MQIGVFGVLWKQVTQNIDYTDYRTYDEIVYWCVAEVLKSP